MKKWLVDVPVSIHIWTRPYIQKRSFEAVKQARPSVLFLISDGPRNQTERELIEQSRKIVEDIDWECEVHKLYMDENQGMYAMFTKGFDFVFDKVDRCIFLEDDVLPSVSFFSFCEELLEKYKDDLRITAINGLNYQGIYDKPESDYFFTQGNSILGYAMWKRTYEKFYNVDAIQDQGLYDELERYINQDKKDLIAKAVYNASKGYRENPLFRNHPAGTEFYRSFINVTEGQLDIVPSKNMITNIGGDANGTHISDIRLMPKRYQKLFDQERYEIELPIKHPDYVIRDRYYEKIMNPSYWEKKMMFWEVVWRNIIYLSPKAFWGKVIKKTKSKQIER